MTDQGAWVVRVDGAWFWHIQVPPPPTPPPSTEPPTPGAPVPPPPAPPPAPTVAGLPQWTPRSTLLFRDSNGLWQEAIPSTSLVSALPPALQGTEGIAFSPDGRQVLYYKGVQLWTALRDGSQARLVGAGLLGSWAPDGTLATANATPADGRPAAENTTPGLGKD